MQAINYLSMLPVRAEAKEGAEMMTMLLFGEFFEVLESNDNNWHKIKCLHDGYTGWVFSRVLMYVEADFVVKTSKEPSIYAFENGVAYNSAGEPFPLSIGARLPSYKEGAFQLGNRTFSYNGPILKSGSLPIEELLPIFMEKFMHAPYLWGGRSAMAIDCSGMTQLFYSFLNISIPRDSSVQANEGTTIQILAEAKAGDLAFFTKNDKINHVGILTGKGTIFQATEWVREDKIDENGIFNSDIGEYGRKVHLIKRYIL